MKQTNKSGEGRTQKYKSNRLGTAGVILAIVTLLAGCGKKGGNDDKLYDVENYPVAEISKGLAQIAPTFSEVYEFHGGLAIVRGGSYYGAIDRDGNMVIPCEYTQLEPCGKVFYAEKGKSNEGVINRNGKEIVPLKYYKYKKRITIFPEDEIIRCLEEDGYYFIDFNGKKLFNKGLKHVDEDIIAFHENLSSALLSKFPDLLYGFVDKTGRTVISPRFDDPAIFFNGVAMVTIREDWQNCYTAFIDKQGNEIMKVFEKGNLKGVVDASGKEVIPCKFKSIDCYDSGYLLTKGENNLNGVWSIKDKKEIMPPMYSIYAGENEYLGCRTFINTPGIIIVKKDKMYGAINTEGKEIVPCIYSYAQVEKGLVKVTHGTELFSSTNGVYDREGNEILKCKYRTMNIGENSIIARDNSNNLESIIFDHKGNEIIKNNVYDFMRHFSEGLAAVAKDYGKFGFYDHDGDVVIEPKYEDAKTFSEGLAPVKYNGKWGYVNRKGDDTFGNNNE